MILMILFVSDPISLATASPKSKKDLRFSFIQPEPMVEFESTKLEPYI